MIENEFKGTTSSEDSDADMAEYSNGFDEATHDQGTVTCRTLALIVYFAW